MLVKQVRPNHKPVKIHKTVPWAFSGKCECLIKSLHILHPLVVLKHHCQSLQKTQYILYLLRETHSMYEKRFGAYGHQCYLYY
jgi:hypothetical protein